MTWPGRFPAPTSTRCGAPTATATTLGNIIGVVRETDYALESIETTFNQDLNGDGTIGLTKTVIQTDTNSFGSTRLTAVANEYFLYDASGSGPDVAIWWRAGRGWSSLAAWVPIGAVQTASGYDVAWDIPGANKYTVWSTDSNGNYPANIIGVLRREQIMPWSRSRRLSIKT